MFKIEFQDSDPLNLNNLNEGTNAREVISAISEVYTFFVLSLGGKVNTRRMSQSSQPDMESIFTKIIYDIFQSQETIM